MKVRECLVSNSSSSSFIVAFPNKPKSVEEVSATMHMELGKTIDCYDNKVDTSTVVKTVFEDIGKNKKTTLKQIADLISQRYYYTRHDGNMFSDSCDYGWVGKDRYYGNDEKLLTELAQLFVKEDKMQQEHWDKERRIISKYRMNRPKNYSELSQKEKDEWNKQHSEWCDTCKEYKKCRTDYFAKSNVVWKKQHLLRSKLAKIDAKKFMEDNAGKPIYIFEYSDNDGEFFCAMEHGEIFQSLPHIVVSHH
jgi:hypothetical protein